MVKIYLVAYLPLLLNDLLLGYVYPLRSVEGAVYGHFIRN